RQIVDEFLVSFRHRQTGDELEIHAVRLYTPVDQRLDQFVVVTSDRQLDVCHSSPQPHEADTLFTPADRLLKTMDGSPAPPPCKWNIATPASKPARAGWASWASASPGDGYHLGGCGTGETLHGARRHDGAGLGVGLVVLLDVLEVVQIVDH